MYYISFLDILGFKNIISNKKQNELINIFHDINSVVENLKKNFCDIPIFYRIMSDSIVVACDESEPSSLLAVSYCSGNIQECLLEKGIMIRGGITYGEFYQDGDVMFGKGLVKAYEIENNIAKYPRIVIDSDSIIRYKSKHEKMELYKQLKTILEKDNLDIYYIDLAVMYLCNKNDEDTDLRIKQLKNLIEQNLLNTWIQTDIREKYIWLKNEFNDFTRRNKDYNKYSININIL